MPERLMAYGTASRLCYINLMGELVELNRRQDRGSVDVLAGAQAPIRLMTAHLAETAQLVELHGVAA